MTMNPSNKLLSDIVAFRTYAKHLPHIGRRESLEETINRSLNMYLDKFPKLSRDIIKAFQYVHERKIMPSMRGLQFAGDPVLKTNQRLYNCSFAPIDHPKVFSEALFLLLAGCGFGFSVQKHHVNSLPKIRKPAQEGYYTVQDSIMGWADALDALMNSYFHGGVRPLFDYTFVSPKGTYLSSTGTYAPGPEPLKHMLGMVEKYLLASLGRKLKPIEVHDIICIISDCVLAGGIRRSSLISLFDKDDDDMLKAKSGSWWEKYPWRARANNSAYLYRPEVSQEEFFSIYQACKTSQAGEPGFFWSNDPDKNIGTNPCAEISLRPFSFCNLTTINQTGIADKRDFISRVYSATLLGTLQATFTDFNYLRPVWQQTTEEDSLLGVSFTGIADANDFITTDLLEEGAKHVLEINEKYAKKLGINLAARTTTVKPEGTTSTVLGSSSGIHARHAAYYFRRVRMNKDDALAQYLKFKVPDLIEDDVTSSTGAVLTLPQESPSTALLRSNETALDLFNRVVKYNKHWISVGHRSGVNKHNVSSTINVREDEWEGLKNALWDDKDNYTAVSLFPFDDHVYQQAPFEAVDKEKYDEASRKIKELDLKEVYEELDKTNRIEIIACSGNSCELV